MLSACRLKSWLLLTVGLVLMTRIAPAQDVSKTPVAATTWSDLSGHTWKTADLHKNKASVFFFVSTECPISNIYTPRMAEIAKNYASQGIAFFLVPLAASCGCQAGIGRDLA